MSEFTGMNKLEAMAQIAKVGYDEGVKDERERIIKLLEGAIDHDWKGSEPCEACDQTDYLIALIKGENK